MGASLQIKNYHPNVADSQWSEMHGALRLLNTNLGIYDPITDTDTILMCTAIQNNFNTLTIEEIRSAFEMFVTLQLEFKPPDFKILSVVLVAQVIESYKKFKKDLLIKSEQHRLPPPAEQKYVEMNDKQTFEFYLIKPYEAVQGDSTYKQAFKGGYEWVLYNRLNHYKVFNNDAKRALYSKLVDEMKGSKQGEIIAECERLTVREWIQNHLEMESDIRIEVSELMELNEKDK